jgi:hypothetical protein
VTKWDQTLTLSMQGVFVASQQSDMRCPLNVAPFILWRNRPACLYNRFRAGVAELAKFRARTTYRAASFAVDSEPANLAFIP